MFHFKEKNKNKNWRRLSIRESGGEKKKASLPEIRRLFRSSMAVHHTSQVARVAPLVRIHARSELLRLCVSDGGEVSRAIPTISGLKLVSRGCVYAREQPERI